VPIPRQWGFSYANCASDAMKIIVFAINYNNADVLPFFLRYYSTFADEISVWDDNSTDGSREILSANDKVIMRDWPYDTGIDEDKFLEHAYEWYPKAHPAFDWVMWVDPDEFIYSPSKLYDVRGLLRECDSFEVITTQGYNMTGPGLPKDDGHSQIYELSPNGVYAPVYSKPVVFKPSAYVRWNRGKHALSDCNPKVTPVAMFKLLHYRYMGGVYTKKRNRKNYGRCGLKSGDKGAAWSCSPGYDGKEKEHSPMWAESIKNAGVNVL
jgi:glycosyl transferase family 2